jgi:hypothetical protein
VKAIQANRTVIQQTWVVDYPENSPQAQFDARMTLRELGAERFRYEIAYDLPTDAMRLRVAGLAA